MWPIALGILASFVLGVTFERNKSAILGGTSVSPPLQTTRPVVQVTMGDNPIVAIGSTLVFTPPLGFVYYPGDVPTSSDTSVVAPTIAGGVTDPNGYLAVVPGQFEALKAGKANVGVNMVDVTNPGGPMTGGSSTVTVE